MSAPLVPVSVSLPLPPALSATVTVPVAMPSSDTVTVSVALPVRRDARVAVRVRVAPAPAKLRLAFGTSAWLPEAPLSVRLAAEFSTSATVRLIVPERSLVAQLPPLATVTVGASLTAVTVTTPSPCWSRGRRPRPCR
jgi:hypothetical protein